MGQNMPAPILFVEIGLVLLNLAIWKMCDPSPLLVKPFGSTVRLCGGTLKVAPSEPALWYSRLVLSTV